MTVLRHLEVRRFRGIAQARWAPRDGVNGLIGPGDSGKSTLLDAIDFALAARRNLPFTDADFFNLDVSSPIEIRATIGALPDALQDLDVYASHLRGWDPDAQQLFDEPGEGREAVLTVRLTVDSDLEPHWSLWSDRATADGLVRDLPYAERTRLAPSRLGAMANHHFSWGARSVLTRVSRERTSASLALAEAAREARNAFGDQASGQVAEALNIVRTVAAEAGVRGIEDVQALLDAHGVSFSGGAIALHDGVGVPLRNLGIGSSRLLVANLQAVAGDASAISLIDELEHGLEPYRITRLLHTLGSKTAAAEHQVFLTTHSPVCVRELGARQLWKVSRNVSGRVEVIELGRDAEDQAALRACAEAFLAPKVLVCEGATEVGLVRGLDLYWSGQGQPALATYGVALADGGGSNYVARALCFARLGYHTALLRDSDVDPTPEQLEKLSGGGVAQFNWASPLSTEGQLFAAMPDSAIDTMLQIAVDHMGEEAVAQHLRNVGAVSNLAWLLIGATYDGTERTALATAAGKYKWFKTVDQGERLGREVLGPHLAATADPVPSVVAALGSWVARGSPEDEDEL